jgi:hypothetical protein
MTVIRHEEAITGIIEYTKLYDLTDEQYAQFKQLRTTAERDEFLTMSCVPFDEGNEVVDLNDTIQISIKEEE